MIATSQMQPVAGVASGNMIPVRNLWHMLLYAWQAARYVDKWRVEVESAPSLDALLALILANLLRQRLRIGLGRNYRQESRVVSGIRGRVNFAESIRRLAFENGFAHCTFDTFNANVPKNQIIRSTLANLARSGEFGSNQTRAEELRHTVRQLVRMLDGIDLLELRLEQIQRELMRRHDADYSLMLRICGLVAQRQMPTEFSGSAKMPQLNRDEMTLSSVYERFVAEFYAQRLEGWCVRPQVKLAWGTFADCAFLPQMRPDLVLLNKGSKKLVVLDTKFTAKVLVPGRFDKLVFDRDHLFQLYAYLRSQDHRSPEHRAARGILLYPTVAHHVSERVEIDGHQMCWEAVDLSQDWRRIEDSLLALFTAKS